MKSLVPVFAFLALAGLASAETVDLFNGKDLTGWEGKPELWSVKDGCITGQTLPDPAAPGKSLLKSNTFLIWKGETADFELTFKYNSGVQYRSKIVDAANFVVSGYQADFEVGKTYSGILYEEKARGILAKRGQKVIVHEGDAPNKPKLEVVGEVSKSDEVQAAIHPADWNDYKIVAKGNHLQHFINGMPTIDVTDETAFGAKSGVLALQIHAGAPMQVQFKELKYTVLK